MNAFRRAAITAALLAGVVSAATAQDRVLFQPQAQPGQFTLAPADGSAAPLFLGTDAAGAPVPPAFSGGGPGGSTVTASTLDTNVGFDYLHPLFAHRSVPLVVPGGAGPAVGVLDPGDAVTNTFAFMPRIDLNYDISDLGFGVGATAEYINLAGNLERTLVGNVGSGDLNASYGLTIFNVNLVEITKSEPLSSLLSDGCAEKLRLDDDTLTTSLGTRISYIQQTYRASLRSGGLMTDAEGDQTYTGFGLTTSVGDVHPINHSDVWSLYGRTRVSLLIGPNNRKSIVSSSDPANSVNNTLIENKTTFLPVAEMELGVQYRAPVGKPRASDNAQPFLFVKTGFVGQYWGDTGFVSAGPQDVSFGDRAFFLVGVSLVGGIQF